MPRINGALLLLVFPESFSKFIFPNNLIMRYFFICLCCFGLLCSNSVEARRHKKEKEPTIEPGPAKTEKELINKLVYVLQYQDSTTYSTLFPSFDTLWKTIMQFRDTNAMAMNEVGHLVRNAGFIKNYDPNFNPRIMQEFKSIMIKGEDSEVHWEHIVLVRYELKKMLLTRGKIGYDKIAPLRLEGYIFFKDMLTRETFGVAVKDIQVIKGMWYGGHLVDLQRASTEDEYIAKMREEERWLRAMVEQGVDLDSFRRVTDSIIQARRALLFDSSAVVRHREIVDRKLYTGLFDNEIPVVLYIQYLKGHCKEPVCSYAAILKFGDEDDYIKLIVSRTPDGKWSFLEEPDISNMELTLDDKVYKGTWLSARDKTEYEVRLKEKLGGRKRIHFLDETLDRLYFQQKRD